MNCPVCNRNFVVALSICPACGTMMNDSVREEHIIKKSPFIKSNFIQPKGKSVMPEKPLLKPIQRPVLTNPKKISEPTIICENKVDALEKIPLRKSETGKLNKTTSPTLLEFQHKENVIPEWRLELKNAVRQKLQKDQHSIANQELFPTPRIINRTAGATALKTEYVEEIEEQNVFHENPKVQNALRRIEKSRQRFYAAEEVVVEDVSEQTPKKDFPYYIASRSNELTAHRVEVNPQTYTVAKPKLISSIPAENFKRDTNKLPPLPKSAKIATSFEKPSEPQIREESLPISEEISAKSVLPEIKIIPQKDDDFVENEEIEIEENEDLAPFAMRFNAGLFDLIIGGFASLILLAPFILLGGEWFTTAGLFAFLATCSIVMFIYMTTSVGMFGKTFGMKMFSLEIIDIEENDYPTFHQAAVSSAVYLLSMVLGGSGFLTVLFTDDRRAVHDIVSGTLIVRDCQMESD
ncbi:MAG: RDD family protein [Pyrinomonadaceae bacterium]